jgi:hypothetical protein
MELVATTMPWVRQRFASHKAYASASVSEVLGERLEKAAALKATTMASTVFLNRGSRLEAVPLPAQAQWSPAMGLTVGDVDGDGHEDIFLGQNFFAVRPDDDRLDAGRGLWLRGDGAGGFQPVSGQESGVKVYGEQRGAALADFDSDGRTDLVVTQNGAETKLYRNITARPGLRVKLELPGKALPLGAQLRAISGERMGPVREIRAGDGYWSQNSSTQVLCASEPTTQIWVRWPGGKTSTTSVPPNTPEIVIHP